MRTGDATLERRALWILRIAGTVVLVLGVVLVVIMPSAPVSENVPGFQNAVIGFELASSPEHVFGILGRPGAPQRAEAVRKMDLGNRVDYLYMVAYSALHVGIALLLAAHGRTSRGMTTILLLLAVTMAVGDALENRELLLLSGETVSESMMESLARLRAFTLIKWYAIYGFAVLAAPFIWREEGWWRWSALFFGAAGVIGFLSVIHLPAIEYATLPLIVAWTMAFVRGFTR